VRKILKRNTSKGLQIPFWGFIRVVSGDLLSSITPEFFSDGLNSKNILIFGPDSKMNKF